MGGVVHERMTVSSDAYSEIKALVNVYSEIKAFVNVYSEIKALVNATRCSC